MNIVIIVTVFLAFLLSIRFTNSAITKFASVRSVSIYRTKYITKTINLCLIIFYCSILVTFLGFEYSQISIFLSSIFAVIGVALFAQWSILSNITASLIIFFWFPYRVGDRIRIIDKDDDITGIIEEITLFHVLIKRNEELITYPNSLILQKGVIKNPKENNQTK